MDQKSNLIGWNISYHNRQETGIIELLSCKWMDSKGEKKRISEEVQSSLAKSKLDPEKCMLFSLRCFLHEVHHHLLFILWRQSRIFDQHKAFSCSSRKQSWPNGKQADYAKRPLLTALFNFISILPLGEGNFMVLGAPQSCSVGNQ